MESKTTDAECIAWLERWLAQYCQILSPDNEAFVMQSAIRKQLKAAQEMARAIAKIKDSGEILENEVVALNLWKEAGGQ